MKFWVRNFSNAEKDKERKRGKERKKRKRVLESEIKRGVKLRWNHIVGKLKALNSFKEA